jgi:hypothetical protein
MSIAAVGHASLIEALDEAGLGRSFGVAARRAAKVKSAAKPLR